MLLAVSIIGGVLMVGACVALAFEDVIEAKSNLVEASEEQVNCTECV